MACAKDKTLTTEDLISMCHHLDKIDDLIIDFYKKALYPGQRVRHAYRNLPSRDHPTLREGLGLFEIYKP